ncbi:MAG TPA: hypothetical protein VFZ21_31715 [Gemmatimonadaceae bacterium]|nr:hypothetical protein [Gemmatimonadaceae bacterium]
MLARSCSGLASSALAVASLAISGAPASADPTHGAQSDDTIVTSEGDCFETGDRRPVALAQARAYVPERYDVRSSVITVGPPVWLGEPNALVADVGFTDYVCQASRSMGIGRGPRS